MYVYTKYRPISMSSFKVMLNISQIFFFIFVEKDILNKMLHLSSQVNRLIECVEADT